MLKDSEIERYLTFVEVGSDILNNSNQIYKNNSNIINVAIESLIKEPLVYSHYNHTLSLEQLENKLLDYIKKIARWVKDAFHWIIKQIFTYSDEYEDLLLRTHSLMNKNNLNINRSMQAKFITNDRLVAFFNKGIRPQEIINTYQKYTSVIGTNFPLKVLHDIKDKIASVFEKKKEIDNNLEEIVINNHIDRMIRDTLQSSLSKLSKDKETHYDDFDYESYSYDLELGNSKLIFNLKKKEDKYINMNCSLQSTTPINTNTKLMTLDTNYTAMLLSSIENELTLNAKNHKVLLKQLNGVEETVSKSLNRMINGEYKSNIHLLRTLKDISNALINLVNGLYNYDRKLIKYLLFYCDYSIKQYK